MPGWSARRFVDSGEKPESIRTCEAKSLYYAGFKSLVKSLENTCVAEVFEGVSPDHEWWRISYNLVPVNCGSAG